MLFKSLSKAYLGLRSRFAPQSFCPKRAADPVVSAVVVAVMGSDITAVAHPRAHTSGWQGTAQEGVGAGFACIRIWEAWGLPLRD